MVRSNYSIMCLLFLAIASLNAYAGNYDQEKKGEWFFSGPLVLLPPLEGFDKNMFLFSGEDNSIVVWSAPQDGGNGYCHVGETRDFIDMNPVSINDEYYKFTYMCLNGNAVFVPKTDEGKKRLTSIVMKKHPVKLSFGDGLVFNYPVSNIDGMMAKKKAMKQAK